MQYTSSLTLVNLPYFSGNEETFDDDFLASEELLHSIEFDDIFCLIKEKQLHWTILKTWLQLKVQRKYTLIRRTKLFIWCP